jgi:hypothetical protein
MKGFGKDTIRISSIITSFRSAINMKLIFNNYVSDLLYISTAIFMIDGLSNSSSD